MVLDRHRGGDRQPQPPTIGQQGDRPDLLGLIPERAGQPHPQRRLAAGDRQPHPIPIQQERGVVAPHRDQAAFAAREPGLVLLTAAFGGLEPGVAVAAQHRPRPVTDSSPNGPTL
jgi:hypothetical protein